MAFTWQTLLPILWKTAPSPSARRYIHWTVDEDLDTDDDGVIDVTPWNSIVDSIAVNDGGAGDLNYGLPVLTANYDGLAFTPGGASRIPDGMDTEAVTDWVRNDFDLAGIVGYVGSISLGEAYNTPGAANEIYVPPPEACGDPFTPIYDVQGSGARQSRRRYRSSY